MDISRERLSNIKDLLADVVIEDIEDIIEVDNAKGIYKSIKCSEEMSQVFKDSGDILDLYKMFYFNNRNTESKKNTAYESFIDLNVFKKHNYRAFLSIVADGEEKHFSMIQKMISEDICVIMLYNDDTFAVSNTIELEKVETIQESYLFSMIVDLSDDTCINPKTSEIGSDRQDFMELKYSEWRLMISNMFKEQDKVLFLRASAPENIINTLEDKAKFHIDLQMMNMQGQFVWSRLSFARMKNFSRENPRFLYTVVDISADMDQLLKQEGITKAVEEQNQILLKADEERTLFFANMSHELRTPLNAIMGMNEVILRDSKDESIKDYARDIKNASQILINLVNDILDFSKIEAGKMEIVPVEYSTANMIKNVSNLLKAKLEMKSLTFKLNIDENLPAKLYGDEIRVTQILLNLMSNAVKYTDKGSVELTVRMIRDTDDVECLYCEVKDTGIGIKEQDLDKLFGAYNRLDIHKNRRVEGTGLGMGIIQGLLTAMDGKLTVNSTYGEGSSFAFVLPQKIVDSRPVNMDEKLTESSEKRDFSDKSILIIDDTLINLKVTRALLKPYGCNVETVDNGKAGLKLLQSDKQYDLVFVDHMMPEMDGVEVLKNIREMDGMKDKAVIALTGNSSSTARDEYRSYGFTDYLEKPIRADVLDELLNMYL